MAKAFSGSVASSFETHRFRDAPQDEVRIRSWIFMVRSAATPRVSNHLDVRYD
jgi:hypothetical protein